ncbi:uncharacterized protein Tco025E_08160 [Trypanosoma conorhini]|uniref:Amastin n=1 Tax=Trypanosoma conorhini TaxID=83891 RepID=A0A422NDI6_9TRYP|nr:uncharacterized protein Tco025E_08160 [Trypanosoma conorhini]RNF03564.1 hypothetical protein Tco025E_08160 [Trypanosoma conorhini]
MTSCCVSRTLLESFRLFFAFAALALAVVPLFIPVFTAPDDLTGVNASSNSTKGKITLWEERFWVPGVDHEELVKVELVDYFTCNNGRRRIQITEGIAIVACVVTGLNFVMCIFSFFAGRLLYFALAIYFPLAVGASATVFALLLEWFYGGWCESQPPLSERSGVHWKYDVGWFLLVVSTGFSLLGLISTFIIR